MFLCQMETLLEKNTVLNLESVGQSSHILIESFSPDDTRKLKAFVGFHWDHYKDEPQYVPLLDYEYLGARFLGMTGFFERKNAFFKHGESRFFLAYQGDKIVGRCNAFVNHRHNSHWKDKVGFFGNFECINDIQVAKALFDASEKWLKSQGMEVIRGPQNFPVNEATPGFMAEGADTRSIVYYHYTKPYYLDLAKKLGFQPVMNVLSWELSMQENKVMDVLENLSLRIIKRYDVTIEHWGQRSLKERKKEMFDIYNDAWNDNFGFVPFTQEEFYRIVDDMQLVMNKKLFIFIYVKGKVAAFFGGVPNIAEVLATSKTRRVPEIIRAIKLVLMKSKIRGFRLGYLGVKKDFRHLGLDGVMLWKQAKVAKQLGYDYCDIGFVLETNQPIIRVAKKCECTPSKKYTIFQKEII